MHSLGAWPKDTKPLHFYDRFVYKGVLQQSCWLLILWRGERANLFWHAIQKATSFSIWTKSSISHFFYTHVLVCPGRGEERRKKKEREKKNYIGCAVWMIMVINMANWGSRYSSHISNPLLNGNSPISCQIPLNISHRPTDQLTGEKLQALHPLLAL